MATLDQPTLAEDVGPVPELLDLTSALPFAMIAALQPGESLLVRDQHRRLRHLTVSTMLGASRPYDNTNRFTVRTRTMVKIKRDSRGNLCVIEQHAEQIIGIANRQRHLSDPAVYSRWATTSIQIMTSHSGGQWVLRSRRRGGGWVSAEVTRTERPDGSTGITIGNDLLPSCSPLLLEVANQVLPTMSTFDQRYPTAEYYGLAPQSLRRLTPATRRAFAGANDAQHLTRNLFGVTRYRRDLVKAVASADLSRLGLAHQFRGLVPIDWIIAFLTTDVTQSGRSGFPYPNVRPVLRLLDQHSLRNLLRDHDASPSTRVFADVTRMAPTKNDRDALAAERAAGGPGLGRMKSWVDLHDALAARQRAYAHLVGKCSTRKVRLPEWAIVLEGQVPSVPGGPDLSIELARHEDTLWAWGTTMRNCIFGYGSAMRQGSSLLLGIHSTAQEGGDPILLGNAEIRVLYGQQNQVNAVPESEQFLITTKGRTGPEQVAASWSLVQLLGKDNRALPTRIHNAVVADLVSHGVTIPRTYEGRDEEPTAHERLGDARW